MITTHQHSHPWQLPLALLPAVAVECAGDDALVFLHSALKTSYSGRYSWLAIGLREQVECDDLAEFFERMESGGSPLQRWFGYLGYELVQELEDIPYTSPASIQLPKLWAGRFEHLYCFDHEMEVVTEYSYDSVPRELPSAIVTSTEPKATRGLPKLVSCVDSSSLRSVGMTQTLYSVEKSLSVASISSNMTKDAYTKIIQKTLDEIHAGNFYQANITRKFYGEFAVDSKLNEPQLFVKLCEQSPAPYAAYIRIGEQHILSSSPELFLNIDEDGQMFTRPIKGTLGRSQGEASELAASVKDQAENLMIVDLMRNDFSRIAKPSSVTVDDLFSIDSFSTLHHMSSNVRAELASGLGVGNVMQACFPAGSMTGAPKIAAMKWCAKQEGVDRGIYSGAIGWCDAKQCEFSVVIRTLLLHGNRFEFQVGGGIVADSNPESEWQETIVKAQGILGAMGLGAEDLAEL